MSFFGLTYLGDQSPIKAVALTTTEFPFVGIDMERYLQAFLNNTMGDT